MDSSKLKEFADDNFKFVANARKFSKWVENPVGKGEIARYEQFLLFPLCFQKACFPGASKGVIVWEWVKEGIETVLRKQEIVGNSRFTHRRRFLRLWLNRHDIPKVVALREWGVHSIFSMPQNVFQRLSFLR